MEHTLSQWMLNESQTNLWNQSVTETNCKLYENCTNIWGNGTAPTGDSCMNNVLPPRLETFLYSILLTVSLLGNILVIVAVHKSKDQLSTVDNCISSMCISDMIIPLVAIPYRIKTLYISTHWLEGPFGAFLCKIVPLATDASTAVSIFSMLFIAIERYRGVLYPTKISVMSVKRAKIIIAGIWVLAIVVHAFYFYTFQLVPDNLGQVHCISIWYLGKEAHKIHITVNFALLSVIPVFLLTSLHCGVICSLRRSSRRLSAYLQQRTARRRRKQNKRITFMLVVIVIVFFVAYTPFIVVLLLFSYGVKAPCFLLFVTLFMFYSYTAVNPVVYFAFTKRYRRNIKRLLFSGKLSQLYRLHSRTRGQQMETSPLPAQPESARELKKPEQRRSISRGSSAV